MHPILHHLTCGVIQPPAVPNAPAAVCHVLLIETPSALVLVDTGIGLLDCLHPLDRLGPELINGVGFRPDERRTAFRQIEARGLDPALVTDIVLTHADPDHTGGLADFPNARVHISVEEHAAATTGSPPPAFPRYVAAHFDYGPRWRPYASPPPSAPRWFGLEARPLDLPAGIEALLVPLPGHTRGHCGVAVRQADGRWTLHAGDAYYLRVELTTDAHPVSRLAAERADDNAQRLASLESLRRLARDHAGEIAMFGYHDPSELPATP